MSKTTQFLRGNLDWDSVYDTRSQHIIVCITSLPHRIDFVFCDFTVPLGIDSVISGHLSWNRICKRWANLVIRIMYWALTICQAPHKVLLFIHLYIKYVLSVFHIQGLSLGSGDIEQNSPLDAKACALSLCDVALYFPQFYFPQKGQCCFDL